MVWDSYKAAKASLREFTPWLREAHTIVRFWSTTKNAWRYTRVLTGAPLKRAIKRTP